MEKRYQVFISSTYEDLRVERQVVMQALLQLDCIPSGMELFPAADDEQWTLIKKAIDDCDYFVVIIGGRYGHIGSGDKSYTQMEYEYATSKGKPVVAFLHGEPGNIPLARTDPENHYRLEQFRLLVKQKMVNFWTSPAQLGLVVTSTMVKLMKAKSGVGWVRADMVADESAAQEIVRLRHKIDELESQLAGAAPPVGSENLAQGEETISLTFRFYALQTRAQGQQSYTFSWNKLLALLGPTLLNGATKAELKHVLQEGLKHEVYDKGGNISDVYIRDEEFQRIKIQFRALGLMTQLDGNDKLARWRLTRYGDTMVNQVATIRSKPSPPG